MTEPDNADFFLWGYMCGFFSGKQLTTHEPDLAGDFAAVDLESDDVMTKWFTEQPRGRQ